MIMHLFFRRVKKIIMNIIEMISEMCIMFPYYI